MIVGWKVTIDGAIHFATLLFSHLYSLCWSRWYVPLLNLILLILTPSMSYRFQRNGCIGSIHHYRHFTGFISFTLLYNSVRHFVMCTPSQKRIVYAGMHVVGVNVMEFVERGVLVVHLVFPWGLKTCAVLSVAQCASLLRWLGILSIMIIGGRFVAILREYRVIWRMKRMKGLKVVRLEREVSWLFRQSTSLFMSCVSV